jgi:hypothetical protein
MLLMFLLMVFGDQDSENKGVTLQIPSAHVYHHLPL